MWKYEVLEGLMRNFESRVVGYGGLTCGNVPVEVDGNAEYKDGEGADGIRHYQAEHHQ